MFFRRRINLIFLALAISAGNVFAQESWTKLLPGIGTFSSPRVADLNNDKVGDIILGAGREEFQACDSAVVAFDGKTGKMLWKVSAKDQIFGSATLEDITDDGIPDVFIGGRSAELIAINGKSGEIVWRFNVPEEEKKEWFNFYNPQFIPDQNQDGRGDILVSNGGDVMAEPHDPDRAVGHLVILDGQSGELISRAAMPDGKETYMSVVVLSGIKLDSSDTKGFVGPAVWVDINSDGIHDIVANAFDGWLLAFDGNTHKSIWKVEVPGTEAYSSPAIGNFNKDMIPDFFLSYSQGSWPKLSWGQQVMVNGSNGQIEFEDSLGFYQMTSAVVTDLNGDGQDEVLLPINYQVLNEFQMKFFYNNIVAIEFTGNLTVELDLQNEGNNLASTPWIGDLDNNGFMDIVYIHGTNVKQTYTFDGMRINRIDTQIPIQGKIRWGSYMGSNYNGVYK
jgi:outer membrane protein assembly factor BamB